MYIVGEAMPIPDYRHADKFIGLNKNALNYFSLNYLKMVRRPSLRQNNNG